MSFQLVPKSVTLNDLERHNGPAMILRYFTEFGSLWGAVRKGVFHCAKHRDWNLDWNSDWNRDWSRQTLFHCAESRDWKLIGLCRFSAQWKRLHWNSRVCSMQISITISITIFCTVKHPLKCTCTMSSQKSSRSLSHLLMSFLFYEIILNVR